MHLAESDEGEPSQPREIGVMVFDGSGWVAGQSGSDPSNSTGIDNTWKQGGDPSDDDLIDTLRQVDNFHKQAREAIAAYLTNIMKAKVNKTGSTEPARRTSDNADSSKPGTRGDKFTVKSAQMLDYLQRDRAEAENELEIQKQILVERRKALNARMELAQVKKENALLHQVGYNALCCFRT